ncbi:transcription factor ORG2-like, partial [Vigna umbellata]|uniref:transcription factor ORG2-like n=1 Tax=Vigna umbellata TaxID=87088 RepID=UPI001F5F6945
MVALFSPIFSPKGWLLEEEPLGYNNSHNLFYKDDASSEYSFPYHFYSPQTQIELEERSIAPSSDPAMVKKLSHNASERDRRKKVNNLVSSLRSLLPMADQT